MGFALDRDTGIFYAWERYRGFNSDSGLGLDTSARQNGRNVFISFYFNGSLAVNSADVTGFNFGRQYGLEFLFASTGLFASCYRDNDVFIFKTSAKSSLIFMRR